MCSEAIQNFQTKALERTKCEIVFVRKTDFLAEKSYPLMEAGREFVINIPFENTGPGYADSVSVEVNDEGSGLAIDPKYDMGRIPPGVHFLALNTIVVRSVERAEITITINYIDRLERITNQRKCILKAQNTEISWESLSHLTPYSTEVAEGSEFVGRDHSVNIIASRCLKEKMQSSYIYGQKRIGKTSLAKAVLDEVESKSTNIKTHYFDWGEISSSDPVATINELGNNIAQFLTFHSDERIALDDFPFLDGSLVSLNKIANKLLMIDKSKRFIVIIDEFDEIQPELYRFGAYADPFFQNLRTLSSKQNMCFILVGGESMPFIISAQGDQLNKYVPESVDYFSREEISADYKELITRPSEGEIVWLDDAIPYLFDLTNGHPYYTKLLCAEAYDTAVRNRDTDITKRDLESWVVRLVERLDVNSFSHFWVDGIQSKSVDDKELVVEKRKRVLVALGKCLQAKIPTTLEEIARQVPSQKLLETELHEYLSQFERRRILYSENYEYKVTVPLFGKWLVNVGVVKISGDSFTDTLLNEAEAERQKYIVSDAEIEDVIENWGTYRGREITCQSVRAWLDQVEDEKEQRAIFSIFEKVLFIDERAVRSHLNSLHDSIKRELPEYVQKKRNEKRNDIFVVYADGDGKSGQRIANKYVDENKIPVANVADNKGFANKVIKYENDSGTTLNGVVVVDDFIGSGDSITNNLSTFLTENHEFIEQRSLTVALVVVAATSAGQVALEKYGNNIVDINFVSRVGVVVDQAICFDEHGDYWGGPEFRQFAINVVRGYGEKISKRYPLGYGEQGLSLVFGDNCPNNSLPILHAKVRKNDFTWKPLFERTLN